MTDYRKRQNTLIMTFQAKINLTHDVNFSKPATERLTEPNQAQFPYIILFVQPIWGVTNTSGFTSVFCVSQYKCLFELKPTPAQLFQNYANVVFFTPVSSSSVRIDPSLQQYDQPFNNNKVPWIAI